MPEFKFSFYGMIVYSRNWFDEGRTRQARKWKASIGTKERNAMKAYFKYKVKDSKFLPPPPYKITIIRYYPTKPGKNSMFKKQKIYDDDNMNGGCKHIRDGIAKGLGYRNDNHPDLSWDYKQKKTETHQAMEVIIETK
jgi:hypothetical protein